MSIPITGTGPSAVPQTWLFRPWYAHTAVRTISAACRLLRSMSLVTKVRSGITQSGLRMS